VLVDRLLGLLRRRSELLELTSLRLQWDEMRWSVMAETEKIRKEIDGLASGEGRWTPNIETARSNSPHLGHIQGMSGSRSDVGLAQTIGSNSTSTSSSSISRSYTMPSMASMSISSPPETRRIPYLPLSPRTPHTLASPSDRRTPSKRTLHLTLLLSQIKTLEIRQRNLASNQVSRSAAILDKMIDYAGPLKDLGGISGAEDGSGKDEALPDDLLDLQDELESGVRDTQGRVEWCRDLAAQWRL
jgi:hypothetical protein